MPLERPRLIEFLKGIFPFQKVDADQLDYLADLLVEVPMAQDQILFEQGEPATALYIVFTGKLRTYRLHHPTEDPEDFGDQVGVCEFGDFTGYEALDPDGIYKVSAVAAQDSLVLELSQADLAEFLSVLPDVTASFNLLRTSHTMRLGMDCPWLEQEEGIYYIARRHRVFLYLRLVTPILAALISYPILIYFYLSTGGMVTWIVIMGVLGLAILGWILWQALDWSNDYSIITNKRVIFQERVVLLYDSQIEAPLDAVLSIGIETDQLGRWFGYGNVIARTYAGKIYLSRVESPTKVVEMLEDHRFRARRNRSTSEKRQLETLLRTRLGMNQPARVDSKSANQAPKPGQSQSPFIDLFEMRSQKGNTIIYRTHWIILLQRISFPTIIFLALTTIFVLSLMGLISLLSPGAMIGLYLMLGIIDFLWWLYNYVDWRNDEYIISDEQIVDVYRKPLGLEQRKAAPLKNIQSIDYEQAGILNLILNFGNVNIRVGEETMTFDNVFKPAEIQSELFRRLAQKNYRDQQAEVAAERQRTAEWLEIYHKINQEQQNKKTGT